jgi:transcriptional regulator with XRE-family HTH domain
MVRTMSRPRVHQTTKLAEWLDGNKTKLSRDEFAERLGLAREQIDRYARADRIPGLEVAFAIEDLTREITEGKEVLTARDSWGHAKRDPPKREGR